MEKNRHYRRHNDNLIVQDSVKYQLKYFGVVLSKRSLRNFTPCQVYEKF